MIRIQSKRTQKIICHQCARADSFWSRFKGLLGKSGLSENEGLWISQCNSVHMWGMRFGIDVVFLKAIDAVRFEVISTRENLKPWKILPVAEWRATDTLELPMEAVARNKIEVGEELCIV